MTAQRIWSEFSLRVIKRIFPLKYANSSFGKCLNNQMSGFQGWCLFFNRNNTELKRSSNIFYLFFFCFRTATLGGNGLSMTLDLNCIYGYSFVTNLGFFF